MAATRSPAERRDGTKQGWAYAFFALLLIVALAIGGFFLLGGDVDFDADAEVDAPSVDVDVEGDDANLDPNR